MAGAGGKPGVDHTVVHKTMPVGTRLEGIRVEATKARVAQIVLDEANRVLHRDMCIISQSYALLAELKNLLRRPHDDGNDYIDENYCEAVRTSYGRLRACDADAECSVNRSQRKCVPRNSHVDVERGDVFQSCEEDVRFVDRWETLAVDALHDDFRDEYTDHGYSIRGINGALLRTAASDRYYMFIGYGYVLKPERLEQLRPVIASYVARCVARAGAHPLVMYGHSMGAQLILDYVLHNLDQVRSRKNTVVILSGCPPFSDGHDDKLDRIVAALSMDRFFNLACVVPPSSIVPPSIDSFVRMHPSLRLVNSNESGWNWRFEGCCDGDWAGTGAVLNRDRTLHIFRSLFPARVKPLPALQAQGAVP